MIELPAGRVDHTLLADSGGMLNRGDFFQRCQHARDWLSQHQPERACIDGRHPVSALIWVAACAGQVPQVRLFPAALTADMTARDALPVDIPESSAAPVALGRCKRVSTEWLLASSGTAGTPTWQCHSTAALLRRIRPSRSPLCWALLYEPMRLAGLQVVLQALNSGGQLVIAHAQPFAQQLSLMRQHGVEAVSATPTWWRKLLMHGHPKELDLRQITLGGEAADQATLDALADAFPAARITHIYAATEVGVVFSVQDGRAGFPADWLDACPGSSTFRVGPHGTLLVTSPDQPERDTGDLVEVVGDRAYLRGRRSGVINVAGNKVAPETVESVIRAVPGVGEVRVSARRSGLAGQLVQAEVVPVNAAEKETLPARVEAACRAELPRHAWPARVQMVNELTCADSGKLDRSGQ